jgi:hypothetical protein
MQLHAGRPACRSGRFRPELVGLAPERGGRAKRCYRLKAVGERALQESAVTAKPLSSNRSSVTQTGPE